MFEIEINKNGGVNIITRKTTINVNVAQSVISASLAVGEIRGPGEFEIGDVTIRGISLGETTIYHAEIGGINIGVIDEDESGLDDLGPIDILVTGSVKSVGEVDPKIVVPLKNADKMVAELKAEVRQEKRLKIKGEASLPPSLEIYRLD